VDAREAPIRTLQSSRASRVALVASGAALLGGVAFYVVFILRSAFRVEGRLTFSLFDDAMISLTYARNLAEGNGLVWTAGESPVEGYTNFLWTLGMTLPHCAGLPERWIALPFRLQPDLVALDWNIRHEERERFAEWGYEKVAQYWVQCGAEIDRRALEAPWR
jgi:hypothetical protein